MRQNTDLLQKRSEILLIFRRFIRDIRDMRISAFGSTLMMEHCV
jgi:hypothetical protein